MTDCNDTFNIHALISNITRPLLAQLEAQGLIAYGYYDVFAVYETKIGGDPSSYTQPTIKTRTEKIVPTPHMKVVTSQKAESYVTQKYGDITLSKINASNNVLEGKYTREQLEGAAYFLIDRTPYDIVGGSLTRETSGLYWTMRLERRKIGGKTQT